MLEAVLTRVSDVSFKCTVELRQEEVYDAFEGIEAEGSGYRRAQIRVCVDIVENEAIVGGLEILDTSHV